MNTIPTDAELTNLLIEARVAAGLLGEPMPKSADFMRHARRYYKVEGAKATKAGCITHALEECRAVDEWARLHRDCPHCD